MNVTSNIQIAAQGIECVQLHIKGLADQIKDSADKNLRQVANCF